MVIWHMKNLVGASDNDPVKLTNGETIKIGGLDD